MIKFFNVCATVRLGEIRIEKTLANRKTGDR